MLVKEFGDELFRFDFNKKWYLPAAGIPGFELDIYRGNYFIYCKLIVDMSFTYLKLSSKCALFCSRHRETNSVHIEQY